MHRPDSAAERQSKERSALIAAYREGLGLAAVAVTCGCAGIHVLALVKGGDGAADAPAMADARWWCRRASDAQRVCAAATARLRRRQSRDEAAPSSPVASGCPRGGVAPLALASAAVAGAAKKLNVALYSDAEISAEAEGVITRVDQEIATLRRSGDLKSLNRSYRAYRLEASARGERVVPYAQWLNKYRANLVCQLANALRYS